MNSSKAIIFLFLTLTLLSACGGGGGGGTPPPPEKETPPDTLAPVITLKGDNPQTVPFGTDYIEAGATAVDNVDGEVAVTISGNVNTQQLGNYEISYRAQDRAGNRSEATRTVGVIDNLPPTITLLGDALITLPIGTAYVEPGVTITDNVDANLTPEIIGEVNNQLLGVYTLIYRATDSSGNQSEVTRDVQVVDLTPPVITILGDNPLFLDVGGSFQDPGVTAIDAIAGEVSVTVSGSVDASTLGSYELTYTATDPSNNSAQATRTVEVVDRMPPVITLVGPANLSLVQDDPYEELGAQAFDNYDGDISVEISGTVDVSTVGTYNVTYSAKDASNNQSTVERLVEVTAPRPFISQWKTDNNGVSNDLEIQFTPHAGTIDFTVDWGDGQSDRITSAEPVLHRYAQAGTYTISINGDFPGWFFDDNAQSDKQKLISVRQWGDIRWQNLTQAFNGCSELEITATDAPRLAAVTSMHKMFAGAVKVNVDLNHWDVASIQDMSYLFSNAKAFNGDISEWNVGQVQDMRFMFNGADAFTGAIGDWNVSQVKNMSYMFAFTDNFTSDISAWNVGQVQDMTRMFSGAAKFNADLSAWNVSQVKSMSHLFYFAKVFASDLSDWEVGQVENMNFMFAGADAFNSDIGDWSVGSVTSMSYMFNGADRFNQDLNGWNVGKVEQMNNLFAGAKVFNGNIADWNVESVNTMDNMFAEAAKFNGDISAWNVINVTSMRGMFSKAGEFSGDLSGWRVDNVEDMSDMFADAQSFDGAISDWSIEKVNAMDSMFSGVTLSTDAYDAILLAWSQQQVKNEVNFDAGNSQYSPAASSARQILSENFDWLIEDGGPISP